MFAHAAHQSQALPFLLPLPTLAALSRTPTTPVPIDLGLRRQRVLRLRPSRSQAHLAAHARDRRALCPQVHPGRAKDEAGGTGCRGERHAHVHTCGIFCLPPPGIIRYSPPVMSFACPRHPPSPPGRAKDEAGGTGCGVEPPRGITTPPPRYRALKPPAVSIAIPSPLGRPVFPFFLCRPLGRRTQRGPGLPSKGSAREALSLRAAPAAQGFSAGAGLRHQGRH
jgi:hypothetical protein